jgi:hypothetical protein
MSDIVERLRREVAWEQDVGELLEEAAAEIARLRLTDAEREALNRGIDALCGVEDVSDGACRRDDAAARTLLALLERLK